MSTAKPTRQAAGVHHRTLGDFVVTVVNDGVLQASLDLVTGIDRAEAASRLAASFRADPPRITINAFAVHTPRGVVLIDSGAGGTMGPTLGAVAANLRAAGIDPADVTTILMTHLHPDHVGGLVDAEGRARYPNAELVVHPTEAGFWLSPETLAGAPEGMRGYVEGAQAAVAPYKARMRTIGNGEAVPGIGIVPAPGHTPGHSGWLLASGGESLLIWGDIVHLPGIQFAQPAAGVAFDADGAQAEATRRRLFDMAATDRVMVAGMHLDFPTFGYVERRGDGYGHVPAVWSPDL